MKLWHGIAMIIMAGMLAVTAWILYWHPAHPATRVPAAAPLGAPVQVAQVGEYEQEDFHLWTLCVSPRHDLLYLAEGRGGLSAAPGIAVIPAGCARPGGSPAPAPRK
jgi:hypothetical protein